MLRVREEIARKLMLVERLIWGQVSRQVVVTCPVFSADLPRTSYGRKDAEHLEKR